MTQTLSYTNIKLQKHNGLPSVNVRFSKSSTYSSLPIKATIRPRRYTVMRKDKHFRYNTIVIKQVTESSSFVNSSSLTEWAKLAEKSDVCVL